MLRPQSKAPLFERALLHSAHKAAALFEAASSAQHRDWNACTHVPPQIDKAWAGTKVGEWISKLLGVWQRLGPFFIQLFDRHPEVSALEMGRTCL
jgi:hypothetical protein